jgi:hypothetical protein
MEMNQSIRGKVTVLIAALALASCGGGGGGDGTPSGGTKGTAEGVYSGTVVGAGSAPFSMLVLENGEFWALYGSPAGTGSSIAGFIQGNGASSSGRFTSANVKDFGDSPATNGTLSATYSPGASIEGTASSGSGSVTFSGTASSNSTYDYNVAASLPAIVGQWSMSELSGSSLAVTIAQGGAFTAASSGGCTFSGTIQPRSSGKNVFDVALTFGPSPCGLPGLGASGVAVSMPTSTGRAQLLIAVVDSTRTYGSAAIGTR